MNAKNYGDDSPTAIGKLNDKILYQRVITGLTIVPSANLTFAFHMQDSRAFGWSLRNSRYPNLFKIRKPGTETPYYIMNPNEEFFEIYDAYVEYNRFYIPVPDDVTLLNTMKLEPRKHHFGDEFDTFISYQVLKHWQMTGAFGYFLAGELSPVNNEPAKNAGWFAFQILFTL